MKFATGYSIKPASNRFSPVMLSLIAGANSLNVTILNAQLLQLQEYPFQVIHLADFSGVARCDD
ncbi:hypothetical protein BH10BAC3_BH10BAC3_05930 [soil metagenome]